MASETLDGMVSNAEGSKKILGVSINQDKYAFPLGYAGGKDKSSFPLKDCRLLRIKGDLHTIFHIEKNLSPIPNFSQKTIDYVYLKFT